MLNTRSLAYVVLLVVAFAVGLIGTLAASRASVGGRSSNPTMRRLPAPDSTPVSVPRHARGPATVEC